MHPELEHALNTGASTLEVIKIFTKYHSGPKERTIEYSAFWNHDEDHNNNKFWDNWQPLFRYLLEFPLTAPEKVLDPPGEPFLGVHKALTREIISWLCDSNRRSNVYIIAEPQSPELHANQNSRAHVIANICFGAQRLASPLQALIGRSERDIYTLSLELAILYPPFRRALITILIDNPGIDELPSCTRFRKLIQEPWIAVQESHPQYIITPPVIILRWDKERWNEEILRSICEIGSSPHSSSLLWIISIDTSFKLPVENLLVPSAGFLYLRLPASHDETPADAALILHHEFSTLRHKHEEMFDEDEVWPAEEQMSELIRIVSGVFESVDVIIQFVDWKGGGGPKAHLKTFLSYMVNSPSPSNERPYCALDHFYIHALSDIPPDLLLVVKKAFSIVYRRGPNETTGPIEIGCLLPLGNDTFLRHLYRFAVIRTDGRYDDRSCLRGFLEDPQRSKQFHTPKSESRHHAFNSYLHILSHSSNLTTLLKPVGKLVQITPKTYRDEIDLLRINAGFELCSLTGIPLNQAYAKSLRRFDFHCLAHTCHQIFGLFFFLFIKHLYALDKPNSPSIVRVKPVNLWDKQLIDKCEGIAKPMDLEHDEWLDASCPKYVLLGFQNKTILALLSFPASENVELNGVNIYTSAMLDYM